MGVTDDWEGVVELLREEFSDSGQECSSANHGSAANTLSVAAARVTADGLPVIAIISRECQLGMASRLSLLSPELQTLGTPITLDANRTWVSAVFSSWYDDSSEQQLVVLRESIPSTFSTSVLVWGAASYLRMTSSTCFRIGTCDT